MTLVPCPRCTDGTYTDANGARWKCFYCKGRRVVSTYSDRDAYDRASDECAETYFETGEHAENCPHARKDLAPRRPHSLIAAASNPPAQGAPGAISHGPGAPADSSTEKEAA